MTYQLLDTVVLDRDLVQYGLRKGDLGAVVEVYDTEAIEVEFVRASGRTQAVVTLATDDVRPVLDDDLVAVRSVGQETRPVGG
ncbi:MAG: DUF4926 domain-containing protein [Candidatus Binatia bacterium]